jgi:hypothetical protein
MDHDKLTHTIRKMIADRNARTPSERRNIYAAARAALERTANPDTVIMMELETAIDEVESSYPAMAESPPPLPPHTSLMRSLAPAAASALVGAVVASLILAIYVPTLFSESKAVDALKLQYDSALPHLSTAMSFLHKVSDSIVAKQKADGDALARTASANFIPLKALDPQLAKQMPATLPLGTTMIVRADKDDFKILYNWTLCGTAKVAKPDMVDPVRDRADAVGCPYFGLWTAGAAKW